MQTYVDSAVIRPLTIPSGAQIPIPTQTARDLIQHKLCTLVNDALIRLITDAVW